MDVGGRLLGEPSHVVVVGQPAHQRGYDLGSGTPGRYTEGLRHATQVGQVPTVEQFAGAGSEPERLGPDRVQMISGEPAGVRPGQCEPGEFGQHGAEGGSFLWYAQQRRQLLRCASVAQRCDCLGRLQLRERQHRQRAP